MAQNKDQDEEIELMTLYLDDGSELECEILKTVKHYLGFY